ncbi:MAG: putative ABC transport system ATP-binding protein [Flavobacteriales bacterium]|jgi:putative ABC transport system ATP-binding protein
MIKAQNVCQEVPSIDGTLRILEDINLVVESGESLAIVGASGSGKSTLLGMLAGLDTPSSGNIFIDNNEITALDEEKRALIRKNYVSFVFQNFQLIDNLSALENIALPLEVYGDRNAQAKAQKFLERVGLNNRGKHKARQLSGGEQQRVALARAFACDAPIIFADEPTGNLDTETGHKIADLLFDINQEQNTTLILVTHSPELAARCSRSVTMHAGKLT